MRARTNAKVKRTYITIDPREIQNDPRCAEIIQILFDQHGDLTFYTDQDRYDITHKNNKYTLALKCPIDTIEIDVNDIKKEIGLKPISEPTIQIDYIADLLQAYNNKNEFQCEHSYPIIYEDSLTVAYINQNICIVKVDPTNPKNDAEKQFMHHLIKEIINTGGTELNQKNVSYDHEDNLVIYNNHYPLHHTETSKKPTATNFYLLTDKLHITSDTCDDLAVISDPSNINLRHSTFKISNKDNSYIHMMEKLIESHTTNYYNKDAFFIYDKKTEELTITKSSHDFYLRSSKKQNPQTNRLVRAEVISNKKEIGHGTFGEVHHIKKTLATSSSEEGVTLTEKPKSNGTRVVKLINADENDRTSIEKEYQIAKKVDHLHMKEPTYHYDWALITMRFISGKNLYDIIEDDLKSIKKLTIKERFEYAIAVLQALCDQLHQNEIIHRDLKPENINVNKVGNKTEAYSLDFGLAKFVTDNDTSNVGTAFYKSPEVFNQSSSISTKSDVWSAARIIAELFGSDTSKIDENQLLREYKHGMIFDDVLLEISFDELAEADGERIENLLKHMSNLNPDNRYSANEALTELIAIYKDIKEALSDKVYDNVRDLERIPSCIRKDNALIDALKKLSNSLIRETPIEFSEEEVRLLNKSSTYRNLIAEIRTMGFLPDTFTVEKKPEEVLNTHLTT